MEATEAELVWLLAQSMSYTLKTMGPTYPIMQVNSIFY